MYFSEPVWKNQNQEPAQLKEMMLQAKVLMITMFVNPILTTHIFEEALRQFGSVLRHPSDLGHRI